MPKIQVPPELLIQVAEKFRLQSIQMEWMISSLDHQMNTMLMWEGTTRQRFFEDFHRARSEMNLTIEYMNSISDELKRIAHRFILVDEELLPLALVGRTEEPKTWLEKAWGSLKEIGNGIMDASNERYDKRYSSVWGFLDYWTAGIPKGAYQGYVERADKLFDSPNDFVDGMTFGIHGTIREAIFPTKAWSTEHVASIIGAAGIATGATVPLMKPKDLLSPRVKYEVRKGNDGLRHDAGGTPKAEGPPKVDIDKIREAAPDYYKELIDKYGDEGRYYARSLEEYESLAKDPAKNFKVNEKSKIERLAGLELEARGELSGPIVRDTNPAGAEFIDATGIKWDVKGWYSKFAPKGYTLEKAIADIEESLSKGENVIIDTSKMFPEHVDEVRKAVKELGLGDKLLWWP